MGFKLRLVRVCVDLGVLAWSYGLLDVLCLFFFISLSPSRHPFAGIRMDTQPTMLRGREMERKITMVVSGEAVSPARCGGIDRWQLISHRLEHTPARDRHPGEEESKQNR